jgi:hypothetical protein
MRAAINAILFRRHTGCPWRYLPRDHFPLRRSWRGAVRFDLPQLALRGAVAQALPAGSNSFGSG